MLQQEARARAWNGDAVAVTELDRRIAIRVRRDRCRQFLHILNAGEVVKLDRVAFLTASRLNALNIRSRAVEISRSIRRMRSALNFCGLPSR